MKNKIIRKRKTRRKEKRKVLNVWRNFQSDQTNDARKEKLFYGTEHTAKQLCEFRFGVGNGTVVAISIIVIVIFNQVV